MGGAGRIAGDVLAPLMGGLAPGGLALTAMGQPQIGVPMMIAGMTGLNALSGGMSGGLGGLLQGIGGAAQMGALGGKQPMSSTFGSWPMGQGGFPQPAMAGTQGGVVPQPSTTPQLAQPTIPMGPPLMQAATAPPTTAPATPPQISPPGAITPTLQEFAQLLRGLAGPAAVGSI